MVRPLIHAVFALLVMSAAPARAEFHLFRVDQVYSNADGSIQYVMLRESTGSNGENFIGGQRLIATSGNSNQIFVFPTNLPSSNTASRFVLIATSGFAALGLVTPDYTLPAHFLPQNGGTITYSGGGGAVNLPALPTDGVTAINANGSAVPGTPTNFAGSTKTLSPVGPGRPDLNQYGLTGSWYEPATSGQGIEVEIYPNFIAAGTGLAAGAWFTYEGPPAGGADRQRWFSFSGNAQSGAASIPITIYRNTGGNFDAPPITTSAMVGTGTLSFSDCNSGTLDYNFIDGTGRSGSIPLTRIAQNVTCVTGTAFPTNADFAFSGNWFDPATSGQGFLFEVNPNSTLFFLTWYTYAPAGQAAGAAGQRWYSGQTNSFTAGSRTVPLTLYESTGGVFDSPPVVPAVAVGSATVTLMSCSTASLQFNFTGGTSAGRSGTINLSRVGPVPPGCVAPASAGMSGGMCTPGPYGEGCPP